MSGDNYTLEHDGDQLVIIFDTNLGKSITNDAERVVEQLHADIGLAGRRLFYRDTMGQFDELMHQDGKFTGFRAGTDADRLAITEVLA